MEYNIKGDVYTIYPCTDMLVTQHYSMVSELVTDVEPEVFMERMKVGIHQELAYYIVDSSSILLGFMYLRQEGNACYGSAIWTSNNGTACILLAEYVTAKVRTKNIRIYPHGNSKPYFKSVVSGSSIKNWHAGAGYLLIPVEEALIKLRKVIKFISIEN